MSHVLESVGILNNVVTFYLGSAKVYSPAIFKTYFSYHKDIWIAVTYYYLPPAAEGRGREIIKCLPSVRPFVTFLHKP